MRSAAVAKNITLMGCLDDFLDEGRTERFDCAVKNSVKKYVDEIRARAENANALLIEEKLTRVSIATLSSSRCRQANCTTAVRPWTS